jgi:sugar O-acyltransferase (sialic acid O-acetyltransferase NeuD family)
VADKLILVGGGGHCKSCIDVIGSVPGWEIAGVLDKDPNIQLPGIKVLGDDSLIEELSKEGHGFLVTIGFITSSSVRIKLFERLSTLNAAFPVIIASSAHVSKYSTIGKGTIVMHNALVNSGAQIGKNCIINTGALVEHDCFIGDHSHISTHAVVNGDCQIGSRVFVGSNAVINNGIEIADDIIIGAGTVVNRALKEKGTYAGNPARKIR